MKRKEAPTAAQAESARLRDSLAEFIRMEKSIMSDAGLGHRSRGAAATGWMREDDADMRHDLQAAFAKARAALEPAPAPSWQPISTAPEGEPHLRAMWVFDAHTRIAKYFCVDAGYIDDDGVFVNMDSDDDFGWSADDYDWWAPMPMPLPAPPEAAE